MCCFSVSCLKSMLGFFSFITFGIGCVALIVGGVAFGHQSSVDFSDQNDNLIVAGVILGLGVLSFLSGLFGMIGGCKKNKCCLCIYELTLLPLLIIALVAACFATYASIIAHDLNENMSGVKNCSWEDATCTGCGNNGDLQWVQNTNTAVYNANQIFGQSADCKIYAGTVEMQQYYLGLKKTDGSAIYKAENISIDKDELNKTAFESVFGCPEFNSNDKSYGQFLEYFEDQFQCSGMCAYSPTFDFSDTTSSPINKKGQKQACYSMIVNFFDSPLVTGISWGIFVYFLMNFVFACCLCCHPERKAQTAGQPMYQRMNYIE